MAAASLFILRRRAELHTDSSGASALRTPGYPLTPALFVLLVLTILILIAVNRPLQAVAGLVLVLLGLPLSRVLTASRQIRLAEGER
jgi:hypothetical protein